MQIVIELDEEEFKDFVDNGKDIPLNRLCGALYHGIPLPNGHGDLIDRKELEMYGTWQLQIIPEGNGKCVETRIYSKRAVDAMPIIIPADKEVSE